jgi:glyoxylase-like metal-dependent hydrolase (beta-lactamase superfamily II)
LEKKVYSKFNHPQRKPYKIVKEKLTGNINLINFFFRNGANVYVFVYEKQGEIRYTFIDAGDIYFQNAMLPIFIENDINPKNIERIIITHGHGDHYGLAYLLAKESGATILVHKNFQRIIEGALSPEEKRWLNVSNISEIKKCNIVYLPSPGQEGSRIIGGLSFNSLIEPIKIGNTGKLEILACPPGNPTHSPEQIIILYSLQNNTESQDSPFQTSHLKDNILFSGDLWLMRGPQFNLSFNHLYRRTRFHFFKLKTAITGKGMLRPNAREQDPLAKEALKTGFCLIRVKPGHGEEFIGTRIIPNALLSDRDLIFKLGYPENSHRSILNRRDLDFRIRDLKESAYRAFIEELLFWGELGYSPSDITALLVCIYKEQSDGSAAVRKDRKERRKRLKQTLTRLKNDTAEPGAIRQLAASTLSYLQGID